MHAISQQERDPHTDGPGNLSHCLVWIWRWCLIKATEKQLNDSSACARSSYRENSFIAKSSCLGQGAIVLITTNTWVW